MLGRAIFFGLNYSYLSGVSKLTNSISAAHNMSDCLKSSLNIPCDVYTDDVDRLSTSKIGMLDILYDAAIASHRDGLEFVWIHYAGLGGEEGMFPSDWQTNGALSSEQLGKVWRAFNAKTRVVFVYDSCGSGVGDVHYSWDGPKRCMVVNAGCGVAAKMTTLAGSLENQVSDPSYNIQTQEGDKRAGMLTGCLLEVLRSVPTARRNVFTLLDSTRLKLSERGFTGVLKLYSTHNLAKDTVFIP